MSPLLVSYLLLSFSTLLQIEYVIAFNLIKRATERGFDLNELPPKSPSPNRSQQPDTQSPTQTSLQKVSLSLLSICWQKSDKNALIQ